MNVITRYFDTLVSSFGCHIMQWLVYVSGCKKHTHVLQKLTFDPYQVLGYTIDYFPPSSTSF